jgi:hypothetical protein
MIDSRRSRAAEGPLRARIPTSLRRAGALALLLLTSGATALAAPMGPTTEPGASDPLWAGFQNPGEAARPRVWWHWMNGNVTWDGARKDMDWMKRVGIAGLQSFDAGAATPQVVATRLPYMSNGWKQVFRNTADYADRLGLELGIAGSPGWSETGGPAAGCDEEGRLVGDACHWGACLRR